LIFIACRFIPENRRKKTSNESGFSVTPVQNVARERLEI